MNQAETGTVTAAATFHPLPWRVEYWQRYDEWHPKCSPSIVDASGKQVCQMPQNVNHPGLYDIQADLAALTICDCVNAASGNERCPECGYTQADCETHGDHDLCDRFPYFSWEFYA